eukprot:2415899-Rhodomonas_salina.1
MTCEHTESQKDDADVALPGGQPAGRGLKRKADEAIGVSSAQLGEQEIQSMLPKPESSSREGCTDGCGQSLTATSHASARGNCFTRALVVVPDAYMHKQLWNPLPLGNPDFRSERYMLMQLCQTLHTEKGRPVHDRESRSSKRLGECAGHWERSVLDHLSTSAGQECESSSNTGGGQRERVLT